MFPMTLRRLSDKAKLLNISVQELLTPLVDQVSSEGNAPLTGSAWQAAFKQMQERAAARDSRYPPGFQVDDSRESIYREREDSQL